MKKYWIHNSLGVRVACVLAQDPSWALTVYAIRIGLSSGLPYYTSDADPDAIIDYKQSENP